MSGRMNDKSACGAGLQLPPFPSLFERPLFEPPPLRIPPHGPHSSLLIRLETAPSQRRPNTCATAALRGEPPAPRHDVPVRRCVCTNRPPQITRPTPRTAAVHFRCARNLSPVFAWLGDGVATATTVVSRGAVPAEARRRASPAFLPPSGGTDASWGTEGARETPRSFPACWVVGGDWSRMRTDILGRSTPATTNCCGR